MSEPAWVVPFAAIDRDALAQVGGKAANLAALAREGFPVPPGCVVTTAAFRRCLANADAASQAALARHFAALAELRPDVPLDVLAERGAAMRAELVALTIPSEVELAIVAAWQQLGEAHAYAVRSSATAEDLPGASFAGQQDTFLEVRGRARLLECVRACWASLFSDRAILYRARQGFDHRAVELAVVIQRMVRPDAAGIAFTAHPVDGRRHVLTIDAGFGLGEALVSGLVDADLYEVDKRGQQILRKQIADKKLAIVPREGGGTQTIELDAARRSAQVLPDAEILALAELATRIEASFGSPQDIEWCVAAGERYVVQARPITTLYPLTERDASGRADPADLRVYVSLGHVQVMTDVLSPFSHGIWKRFLPLARDARGCTRVLQAAGGRLFIDPSDLLRLPRLGRLPPKLMSLIDPRTAGAMASVAERPAFRSAPRQVGRLPILVGMLRFASRVVPRVVWRLTFARTRDTAASTRAMMDAQLAAATTRIAAGASPFARVRLGLVELSGVFERMFFPIVPSIMTAGIAGVLLRKLAGGRIASDDLDAMKRGLAGNVTTQMDLELGDLADLARESIELVAWLRTHEHPRLDALEPLPFAARFVAGLRHFLAEYGMRGGSEIDIARARWADDPGVLLQVVRGNLAREQAGAHRRHHERMTIEGEAAAVRAVAAVRPWLRPLARRLVRVHRDLAALREHPKFQLVRLLALIRAAVLEHARELVAAGRLEQVDDVWLLDIDELLELGEGGSLDAKARVAARRGAWALYAKLSPPRVMTSEGEIVGGEARREGLPDGALVGTPASAGIVEGIVRVVLDPTRETLHAGEILVAPFTDPGWTPLFINAIGLVMEVGGLMTHGSVVAREYGIPAVVSVDGATTKLRTGMRVRIDGAAGLVEILAEPDAATRAQGTTQMPT